MLDMDRFYKDLEELVNIDSGSYDVEGINKVQDWLEARYDKLGWKKTVYNPNPERGRAVLYSQTDDHNFDLLVLCHVDTVFPKGEAEKRPFSKIGNELRGPGVADMKAGCLLTLYAVEEIIKGEHGNIGVFYNSDEEISSVTNRPYIEDAIKKSRIVIGGEPARINGGYVNRRRGMVRFDIVFEGIAAHSGTNAYDGACAVEEMAHWILDIKQLDDREKELTINTGIAKGGSAANAIPDHAELLVTARVKKNSDAVDLVKKIESKKTYNPKVKVKIKSNIARPPMEPDERTKVLCEIIEDLGRKYNVGVRWVAAGGGADTSFATALGKPALCALTPMYKDAHTVNEALLLDEIQERYAIYRDAMRIFSLLKDEELNKYLK